MSIAGAPQTFVEDLARFLATSGDVQGILPGATFNVRASADAELPYMGFELGETSKLNVLGGARGVDTFAVNFFARDTESGSASRLGERLKDILLPTPTFRPQPYSGPYGREVNRYTNGPDSLAQDPENAPYGKDCWVYTFPVVFMIARG